MGTYIEMSRVPADTYDRATSVLVHLNDLEQMIQQIIDMGGGSWDLETVVRALRAAYNNPERAVEYLYSGIPEETEVAIPGQHHSLDYPILLLKICFHRALQILVLVVVMGPLTFLEIIYSSKLCVHWSKQIHKICRFVFLFLGVLLIGCSHSELIVPTITLLRPMLQELGKQNPQVMRLIQQHQAEFLQLINEPHEGAEGDLLEQAEPDIPHSISVTPEEQAAIERLEAMGFDRALVIEAFLACDRNEELAVNYLLENAGDYED
ncbi:hypothetical protein AAC387_Pa10g0870 [Persea americana]